MPDSAPTQWLSTEQQEIWRAYLDAVALIDRHLDVRLRPFGLDLGEYEILVRLSESEDRTMRMSDLAAAARQSRSRLTHTVSRLEKKGLIERAPCPEDRRGVTATLTPEGMDLLVAAAPDHVASVREILIDVVSPDDFAALGRAMHAINAVAH